VILDEALKKEITLDYLITLKRSIPSKTAKFSNWVGVFRTTTIVRLNLLHRNRSQIYQKKS
jgi:hypothetical protein